MVQSWDLAFKDTKASDYVVGQVWLRVGADAYLLDMVRGRFSFNRTVQAIRDLSAKWPQAIAKYVEDKANGPAVINALGRLLPGLIPIEPEGSKYARAAAISPFAHSKNIILPDPEVLPNVSELLLEAAVSERKRSRLESFTMRELEVAQLIAEGNSNKQIARQLQISVKTVESHRAAAMRKAGVRTAAEFVRFGIKHNLIQP